MSSIALFSSDGALFVLRWLHFFFGIIWIGHLYYFNFTQGAFMPKASAGTKQEVIQKLVPEALWWFRWGAMFTFITGWLYIGHKLGSGGSFLLSTSWGVSILTGATFASLMWFNVWFIIWPKQKIVIASNEAVLAGKPALPEAAAAAPAAALASRTNTLFSVPMLFFMGAASHLPIQLGENTKFGAYAAFLAIVAGALQFNAVKGKMGPMTTVKGVIHMGFILTLVVYFGMEIIFKL